MEVEATQDASDDHNPIFQLIFDRVREPGDEIIAYIAYGIYKERKRAFLSRRQSELGGQVPVAEIETFVRTYDEGQIDLVWNAAKNTLAAFAINYADAEKERAAREALAGALKGNFWKQVWVAAAANMIFALGLVVLYFMFLFFGVDLLEQLRRLETLFPQ